jgi:Right handed beta helix region
VLDSVVRRAGGVGIKLAPGTGIVDATLDGVRLERNGTGLALQDGARAVARRSLATGSGDAGFAADGATSELTLADALATDNAVGVRATNGALVRFTGLTATGNATAGLETSGGGTIVPFAANLVSGNPPGGDTCQLAAAGAVVPCPDLGSGGTSTCPPCPQPVCEAPIVNSNVGPCKRCRTRRGVTTCKQCTVEVR